MGLFDKLLGKDAKMKQQETSMGSQDVADTMMIVANTCAEKGDYEGAFHTYKQIVSLQPNATAQYNLGSLYAQGKGTEKNYLEGAYWFHQANLSGDEQAGKLCMKCIMDYIHQNLDQKSPEMIFQEMLRLTSYLYPREDSIAIAVKHIYDLAGYHFNKKEYGAAAKLFRAAAEYGNDGNSQNYLAVLYNSGSGVEKNDLAALYWFDRAADNHIEVSKQDRNGLLNAYYTNSTPEEFFNIIETLAWACTEGSEEIPQDVEKAEYWRNERDRLLKRNPG